MVLCTAAGVDPEYVTTYMQLSIVRAEARKLKADATAALDSAKRKIEKSLVND